MCIGTGFTAHDRLHRSDLQRFLRFRRFHPYPSPMPRAVLLALISLLSLVAVGCGSGAASGGDDPAGAVPASAAFYVDATVRPDGDLRDEALDAAGKVLRTSDPQAKIDELIAKAFAESEDPKVDYKKDIAPWLGEKVALWGAIPGNENEDFHGALIASVKDEDAAQSAIDRTVKGSDKTFSKRSYKDVDYQASTESAVGLVEGFFVVGTEPEFKKTVDAAKGDGLDSDKRFSKAMDTLEENRLGSFYVNFKALLDAAVRQDPEAASQIEQVKRVVAVDKIGPIAGAFMANGDRMAVDATAQVPEAAVPAGLGSLYSGGATPLLTELPGDSWAAFGAPDFGPALKGLYQQVAGALGGAAIENELRQQLGLDLQEDVFSWIGDVAVFARGTTMDSIDGGLVIEVTNPAKAKSAFGKLLGLAQARGGVAAKAVRIDGAETAFEAAMPGSPKPVVAARSEDRVVIAYGREAAAAAFGGGEKLGDSDTYATAKSVLGDVEPGFLLSVPAVLELVEASGETDADYEKAKPYLQAFGILAGGSSRDGDTARSRSAVELK